MDMALVRTTLESETQAQDLARRLVEQGLACCVHLQRIRSFYQWEGAVQEDDEWLVEARVPQGAQGRCRDAILEGHPYDVPLVEVLGPTEVPEAYGAWAHDVMA